MIRALLARAAWSCADRAVALLVGNPWRSAVLGAALLYFGARTLGWWLIALIVAGAAWELVRWPGRLPWM